MGIHEGKVGHIIVFIILCIPVLLNAGDKENSLAKRQILDDIDLVQSIIADNTTKSKNLYSEINYLEYQIIAARKIVKLIESKDKASKAELDLLDQQLNILKQEQRNAVRLYQSIILEEYKNRDYKTKLFFLASSKSLSQFVNRLNHLNTLKEFRKKQLRAVSNKQKEVQDKLNVYKGSSAERKSISKQKINKVLKLSELLRQHHQKYNQLVSEKSELTLDLKNKKQALEKFYSQVKLNVDSAHFKDRTSTELRLKWPVKKGLVVGQFGIHKHVKERKVSIENNGIDILVSINEIINATENGIVKAILEVPGSNSCILLDHGKYYSVLSNVKDVIVKVGDKVRIGDNIAKIAKNDEGLYKLHFELWEGTSKVDPEIFLEGTL